jgi:hypothetical protein
MTRITPIAREAFVPSVKPVEDSIAIGTQALRLQLLSYRMRVSDVLKQKPLFYTGFEYWLEFH